MRLATMVRLVAVGALWALAAACGAGPLPAEPPPRALGPTRPAPILFERTPVKRLVVETRRDNLIETLHGRPVPDPYRWLEDGESADVSSWVDAQNRLTENTLSAIPERRAIHARLEELLGIGQLSLPSVRRTPGGFRYFYTRREGKQNQPVLYVRDGLRGKDRALVDPNAMSAAGTIALDWYVPSNDGSLLAYGTSADGSEESTLYVRDVRSGKDRADVITRARYASVCFMPDNKRFFYSRFPAPGSVPKGEEKYHRKIFEHVMGRDPEKDPLVFGAGIPATDFPGCAISSDGRWLVVRVHQGWSKSEVYLADTTKQPLDFVRLTEGKEHVYNPSPRNDTLYVQTNEGAPRYALYAVDPTNPARKNWRLVVPEHATDVLNSFASIGSDLLASYMHDAVSRLERFDRNGKSLGAIELPTLGTTDGWSGVDDGKEAFFDFESFAVPPEIRRLDLTTGKQEIWEKVSSPIAPGDFAVTPGKARSKDGTAVPYLMVHKKGVDLKSAKNPTLLYGYGGFNVNLVPRFSRSAYVLLERGGVYVQANLRGGGEFGEDWHRAGQLDKKQNVFDDFIAVAEKLISERVTEPAKLSIHGRSNGGLLVAAAVTQRPELFRAVVSSVPLSDMIRYHRFLIAKLWIPEYGSPEKPDEFRVLEAYSPYHRVRTGTAYPAVLLTTAVSDTRVDPMHARKLAAALQHATSSERPVLLRTEVQAGHGAGKPISKIAEEFADIYAFILWQLGAIEGPKQ
jgi:prolyl oligopeptidase